MGKTIQCPYFSSTLYQIMEWDPLYRYRIRGIWAARRDEQIITFSMDDAMPIARVLREKEDGSKTQRLVEFCPADWSEGFGEEFYRHCLHNPLSSMPENGNWEARAESHPVSGQFRMTTMEELRQEMKEIRGKAGKTANGE